MTLEFTAEDMAWTFRNFYPQIAEQMYDDSTGKWNPDFLNCMKALAIVAKEGFGDCFLASDFLKEVRCGMFTSYDGDGYFCDEDGNDVGGVWDSYTPVNAKFALWFNK